MSTKIISSDEAYAFLVGMSERGTFISQIHIKTPVLGSPYFKVSSFNVIWGADYGGAVNRQL